jgi:hypothetical protein
MKWTRRNDEWYDENNNKGTPSGLPREFSRGGHKRPWKDYDFYDDGVEAQTDPVGYAKKESYGQIIWMKDPHDFVTEGSVALQHLIEGAHSHDHKNWHRSSNISGSGVDSTSYYLHPGKNDGTLFLLDQSSGTSITMHSDGNPMIEIIRQGKVSDGKHKF